MSTAAAPNYELIQQDGLETNLLEVSMGPHHPSTHGVFRMDVKLDGETVVDLRPVFGYLHRNHEKLAENMSYLSSMPFTDRLDYFNSMTNNWAYALAAEKLIEVEVPERAEYLRVIMAELTRLVNHVSLVGFFINDLRRAGHAATVRLPRAREDSRPLRAGQRSPDDVQLLPLRRPTQRRARGMARTRGRSG